MIGRVRNWFERRRARKALAELAERLQKALEADADYLVKLSERERRRRKHVRSKYMPHQGEREKARRRRQMSERKGGL